MAEHPYTVTIHVRRTFGRWVDPAAHRDDIRRRVERALPDGWRVTEANVRVPGYYQHLSEKTRPDNSRLGFIDSRIPERDWVASVLASEGIRRKVRTLVARGSNSNAMVMKRDSKGKMTEGRIRISRYMLSTDPGSAAIYHEREKTALKASGCDVDRLDEFQHTVLHEIAHLLAPKTSLHDRKFRGYCVRLHKRHLPHLFAGNDV